MRLLALTLLAATAAQAQSTLEGHWLRPGGAIVQLYDCGSNVCLKLVKLPADAAANTDIHNPDAALHTRALCGLDIGTGFHHDDPTHLSGGRLYDPKVGKTYKGTIVLDGQTLKLHGYVGISAFGRTEEWKRAQAVPVCK